MTRNDFKKAVEKINKENKEDLDEIQEANKKIIEEYKEELKQLIKEIQQIGIYNMKKYKDTNSINYKLDHHEFQDNYYAEENMGVKLLDNTFFDVTLCIPFINSISYITLGLTSFIDWIRGHEKEYEEFIVNYKKHIQESIDNYKFNITRQIDKLKKECCEQIENIFAINGKDIDKIRNNKDIFKKIGKSYEMILNELITNFK